MDVERLCLTGPLIVSWGQQDNALFQIRSAAKRNSVAVPLDTLKLHAQQRLCLRHHHQQ